MRRNILSSPRHTTIEPSSSDSVFIINHGNKTSVNKIRASEASGSKPSGNSKKVHFGMISLMKDILVGIWLGTMGMCVLFLLDYSNIMNLGSVRTFRKLAPHVPSNPEIVETIEEVIGKMLMPVDVYSAMHQELADSQAVIQNERRILDARTLKVKSLKTELTLLRTQYDSLMKQTGLDAFCPDCKYCPGVSCRNRVDYLLEQYSDDGTTIGFMSILVNEGKKNGNCIKSR